MVILSVELFPMQRMQHPSCNPSVHEPEAEEPSHSMRQLQYFPMMALINDVGSNGPAIFSSNLCLANRLCDLVDLPVPKISEWSERLAEAREPTKGNPAR